MAGLRWCLFLFCCVSLAFARKLPSYITQCNLKDPQLNKCVLAAFEVLRPRLVEGIPEMKLPSISPFHLDKISVNSGSFALELTNVSTVGILDVQFEDLAIDIDKNLVIGKTFSSQVGFRSDYNMNGNLGAIALHGSGYAECDFINVHNVMKISGTKEKRNGKEYLVFDKIENELHAEDAKFRFDDLVKGNPELTARANEILNENSQDILKDIKKMAEETLGSIIMSLFKGVFDTFSLDELFS